MKSTLKSKTIVFQWKILFSATTFCAGLGVLTLSYLFSASVQKNSNEAFLAGNSDTFDVETPQQVNLSDVFSSSSANGYYTGELYSEKSFLSMSGEFSKPSSSVISTEMLQGEDCSNPLAIQKARLQVLTTTTIAADLLREIGGMEVCVTSLMGVGVDPHSYVAREGDVRRMLAADVVFYHGLHLEAKMGEILEGMKKNGLKKVYNLSQNIPKSWLISTSNAQASGGGKYYDPHVWFDVRIWKKAAETAELAMKTLRPEKSEVFAFRGEEYIKRLALLHWRVKNQLAGVQKKVLVTSHDAFSYFGRAYGMEVVALKGINTQTQSGLKDMQRLIDLVVEQEIPAIFTENSMSKKEMETVAYAAKARGHNLKIGSPLFTDALGSTDEGAHSYEAMLLFNVRSMVHFLSEGDKELQASVMNKKKSPTSNKSFFQ